MGYVDFADLPNQVRCKSVAKGSDSLVMVVGKGQNTDSKSLPSSIPLFIQPSTLPKNISGLLLNGRGQCPIQSILPAYVLTRLYGQPNYLAAGVCLLSILQIVVTGLIMILLNKLLQRGYPLALGISLPIATNICESII
ncbi:hypothetical protein H4Q26_015779 [Puccinia striiformis f. sp. tritici PST-130]|nr:hypothetical protein H4Q26_015779 [Puccinia striiformis f. sp. tritici PST-130]